MKSFKIFIYTAFKHSSSLNRYFKINFFTSVSRAIIENNEYDLSE